MQRPRARRDRLHDAGAISQLRREDVQDERDEPRAAAVKYHSGECCHVRKDIEDALQEGVGILQLRRQSSHMLAVTEIRMPTSTIVSDTKNVVLCCEAKLHRGSQSDSLF